MSKVVGLDIGAGSQIIDAGRPAVVIVAEQGRKWLAALRMCLHRSGGMQLRPQWMHLRLFADVSAALSNAPTACVVFETTWQTCAGTLAQLDIWRNAYSRACFVAAVDRPSPAQQTDLMLALLEAGAASVIVSPRRAGALLPLIRRHFHTTTPHSTELPHLLNFSAAPAWSIGPTTPPSERSYKTR